MDTTVTTFPTFEAFFSEAEPVLRTAFVARYGPELGRDVSCEALAWAFEHWDQVAGLHNPKGYLFRVGQSAARRLRRQDRVGDELREPEVAYGERWQPDVHEAIAQLPNRQRAVVVLRYGLDLPLTEIASLLDLSTSTVQRHADRGLANLRRALGSEHDDQ